MPHASLGPFWPPLSPAATLHGEDRFYKDVIWEWGAICPAVQLLGAALCVSPQDSTQHLSDRKGRGVDTQGKTFLKNGKWEAMLNSSPFLHRP